VIQKAEKPEDLPAAHGPVEPESRSLVSLPCHVHFARQYQIEGVWFVTLLDEHVSFGMLADQHRLVQSGGFSLSEPVQGWNTAE
jgi:hypothetical protein